MLPPGSFLTWKVHGRFAFDCRMYFRENGKIMFLITCLGIKQTISDTAHPDALVLSQGREVPGLRSSEPAQVSPHPYRVSAEKTEAQTGEETCPRLHGRAESGSRTSCSLSPDSRTARDAGVRASAVEPAVPGRVT